MQGTNNSIDKDIRFEALFNSASMGIIVVDKKGIIVLANHFANELFGYTAKSMAGEVLEKLIQDYKVTQPLMKVYQVSELLVVL